MLHVYIFKSVLRVPSIWFAYFNPSHKVINSDEEVFNLRITRKTLKFQVSEC